MPTVTFDSPQDLGIDQPGFGFDHRPGANPDLWDTDDGVHAWEIPGQPTVFTLKPAVYSPDWSTTSTDTGIFARDRLSHYAQAVSNTWEEYPRLHDKDWTFLSKVSDATLTSADLHAAGTGFAVDFHPYGPPLWNEPLMSVTFGHTDPAQALTLDVREDGSSTLTRGASEVLGEGNLTPDRQGSLVGHMHRLAIFPHGRNRILFSCSSGGRWLYEDKSISREDPLPSEGAVLLGADPPGGSIVSPTVQSVTKAGPLKVRVRTKAAIQPKPLRYFPSGSMTIAGPSVVGGPTGAKVRTPFVTSAPNMPLSGPSVIGITGDGVPYIHVAMTPPHAVNQGQKGVTPTVTLTRPSAHDADTKTTPVFYRLEVKADATHATKATAGPDIASDVIEWTHTHSSENVTGTLRVRYAQNHGDVQRKFNLPFQWGIGSDVYMQGILQQPEMTANGASLWLQFGYQDDWKRLEDATIKSLGRLDGYTVSDAVKKILTVCGWPSDGSLWDIDTLAVPTDGRKGNRLSKGEADEEATNLTDAVRSGADWLRYLRDTYTSAATAPFRWVMGFWATNADHDGTALPHFQVRFYFKNPDTLPTTPACVWYPDTASAMTTGVMTRSQARLFVYGQYAEEAIEPECNDLIVQGVAADGSGLLAHKEDKASKDPTVAIADRHSNWLGTVRNILMQDASLNTQALTNAACAALWPRLSTARLRATLRAEWQPQLKPYAMVRRYYYNTSSTLSYDDWRVVGHDVRHVQDSETDPWGAGDAHERPARYRLERWL